MPTNYGVQGPNLGQYGADTQYASPVVGQDEGIPIGGSGAGFLPSQQELRRLSEQNEKRARNQQMVQELQKIMAGIQTPSNYGLSAGSQNTIPLGPPGIGGNIGGNEAMAKQFFGGQTGNPLAMEAPGGFSSLDGVLNSVIAGIGFGQGGAPFSGFGGGDIGSFGGGVGGGGAGFNLGSF